MRNLDLIRYLYDEQPSPDMDERLASDDALRSELAEMQDMKARLDRRAPARPDPETLDAVLRAARRPVHSTPVGRFADRPARPRRRRRLRALGAGSLALTVCLLLVVFGYWIRQPEQPPALALQTEADDARQQDSDAAFRVGESEARMVEKKEINQTRAEASGERTDAPVATAPPATPADDEADAVIAADAAIEETLAAGGRRAARSGVLDVPPPPVPSVEGVEEEERAALGALLFDSVAREAEPLEGERMADVAIDGRLDRDDETLPAWDPPDDLLLVRWRIGSLETHLQGLNWGPAVPLDRVGLEAASERRRP